MARREARWLHRWRPSSLIMRREQAGPAAVFEAARVQQQLVRTSQVPAFPGVAPSRIVEGLAAGPGTVQAIWRIRLPGAGASDAVLTGVRRELVARRVVELRPAGGEWRALPAPVSDNLGDLILPCMLSLFRKAYLHVKVE